MWLISKLLGKESSEAPEDIEKSTLIQYEYITTIKGQGNIALLKSILESEKITYFIKGEFDSKAQKELLVKKEQKDDVLDILKAYDFNLDITF